MSSLTEIAARRGQLLERARHDREAIARALAPLAAAVRLIERAWPIAALAFAALAVSRPRRALRWLRFLASGWQAWKWLRLLGKG